jgi:biotin carboxyl carrier protein
MPTEVRTQTAGNMWKVLVKPGDTVREGDTLFIMEVMKMEVAHEAPTSGTVAAVHVAEGDEGLDADQLAVVIE